MLEQPASNTDLQAQIDDLRAQLAQQNEEIEARRAELEQTRAQVAVLEADAQVHILTIEKLRMRLEGLLRRSFGASSERIGQLHLGLEEIEVEQSALDIEPALPEISYPAKRERALPASLPRKTIVRTPACGDNCPDCGGTLRALGEDSDEVLDIVTQVWQVLQTIRPKYSCRACDTIIQAPALPKPVAKAKLSFTALAHIIVAKWDHHLPFYRQAEMMAAKGVPMERSTLARSAGHAAALLDPIVSRIREIGLKASKLHTDDTTVTVLDPGKGKTRAGRFWIYVADNRSSGSSDPPLVWYQFTPDRTGSHPAKELATFTGHLQADAYSGYNQLYREGRIREVACWAHFRRGIVDLHKSQPTAFTTEALARIQAIYRIEDDIRGASEAERRTARQERTRPLVDALHGYLDQSYRRMSARSKTAEAVAYGLKRWDALTRFIDNGLLEIDNMIAERYLRGIALGRKNWLFAGSAIGGERAAAILTVIETAKMNNVEPEAYIADVMAKIADDWPASRWDELMPWNWQKSDVPAEAIAA